MDKEFYLIYTIKERMFIRIREGFSAMWILPLEKVKKYISEKEFVEIPESEHDGDNGIKPYYSYYYWEKHCKPLIPLDRIDDCFVHHMSNKYINYYKTIQLTELYHQMNLCRDNNKLVFKGKKEDSIIFINRSVIKKVCVQLISCQKL